MGTTSTFLKSRVSKPTEGKWSSGFTAVKKYADDHKIPLIGVWSNGDVCGHCTSFETAVMNATFKKWMEASGCVFWFGCSSDKTADDKTKGTGYKWAWDNGKLNLYPFVRVWWKAGKVDECQNGDYWTGGSSKGYNTFISKLKTLLKNFKPNASTEDKPSTDNGGCDGDACNVDTSSLKKELDSLKSEFNAFTKEFTSKIEALSSKIG